MKDKIVYSTKLCRLDVDKDDCVLFIRFGRLYSKDGKAFQNLEVLGTYEGVNVQMFQVVELEDIEDGS